MKNFLDRLKAGILIADGAMGSILQERGLPAGAAPDEWNISHPEVIDDIHRAYIKAGAELIVTNTFGANRLKLKKSGLEEKTAEINTGAVSIARKAAQDKAYVAGDIGSTGEFMEPLGSLKREDLINTFAEQARFLAGAGVDLFIIETMTDIEELLCAVEGIGEVSKLPVIASMSFEPAGQEYRTMMGIGPSDMFKRITSTTCRVIGANCGLVPEQMKDVIADLKKNKHEEIAAREETGTQDREIYFIAQPNAGHARLESGKTVFDQTPDEFAREAVGLINAGANIIGGCCGTTPEHIKKLCESITSI